MAVTDNKPADTTSTTGGAGNALSAKEKEAKAAAAAAKNTANQKKKNHPSNASNKKKQQVAKSKFEGLASGTNPMKGTVIALANGNLLGQYRTYQNTLAGSAAADKAYGLDSVILDLVAKIESDFVTSKPDPLQHSNVVTIYKKDALGADTTTPTGEKRLVCFDPILKESTDSNYFIDVKIQKANWNNYDRFSKAYYRTAIGNVEDVIITYCRADKRMALVETEKDLIGFLQILRSVCAQTNGIVKVDQEFQNLHTLHAAIAFKQAANVDDSTFSKQVQDRYKSAIFTCGKFAFGQASFDKVLQSTLPAPVTLDAYLKLTPEDQAPYDKLVEERIVARLIVKNSLNKNLKAHLMTTYSTAKGDCYPNTINDALALLSTFAGPAKNAPTEDAVVSYHEASSVPDPVSSIQEEAEENLSDPEQELTIEELPPDVISPVEFNASVMATVIAEATKEADNDRFFGASFAQLQDVDDIYDDNEPDFVTCAHIAERPGDSTDFDSNSDIDHAGDRHGDSSDWDTDEWNRELDENRNRPKTGKSPITINKAHGFETVVYLTAQRVKNTGTVRIKHYGIDEPDLISYEYVSPTPEHIIDYSDVIREKLKLSGIRDTETLAELFEDCSIAEAARRLGQQLRDVNQTSLHGDTVRYLKEETERHYDHIRFYSARYDRMITEIGPDDERELFPAAHVLLHHTVVAVSINQRRRKPNRWINKVTRKLVNCGVNTVELLESKLNDNTLNLVLQRHGLPKFHIMTIHGFNLILDTSDFRQGRS
jgi:hypothetical protein